MRMPFVGRRARMVRQQRRLRRDRVEHVPDMTVRVTIERRQGSVVTSAISGVGVDLAAALWNARGRARNMMTEVADHLARFPADDEQEQPS